MRFCVTSCRKDCMKVMFVGYVEQRNKIILFHTERFQAILNKKYVLLYFPNILNIKALSWPQINLLWIYRFLAALNKTDSNFFYFFLLKIKSVELFVLPVFMKNCMNCSVNRVLIKSRKDRTKCGNRSPCVGKKKVLW